MVELTIGDLLRWKPVQMELVGSLEDQVAAIETEFSWAVCIRSTTPVLPALRGQEIVIVPHAVLDELDQLESIRWPQVVAHLSTLPIAAVVTDHPGVSQGIDGVVVIEVAATGGAELETGLNRAFTERRGSLYQLGSELARSFSSASIGGSDLDDFLRLASRRAGIPLVLVTSTGRRLAASTPTLEVPAALLTVEYTGQRAIWDGTDWISHPVSAAGLPDGVHLFVALPGDEPGDRARLVLEQTSEALGLMFDRLPAIDPVPPTREAGEILAEFVTSGVLPPAARRRISQASGSIDLESSLRLIVDLQQDISPRLSFLLDDSSLYLTDETTFQSLHLDDSVSFIASPPIAGIDRLPPAARTLMKALRLRQAGHIPDGGLDLGMPRAGGVLGVLLALESIEGGRLVEFDRYAKTMLDDLDFYDRSRTMDLVQTLGTFLDAGASIAAAAERLQIHRNTLAYRIARIIEVSGHDLSDPRVRFDLQFAIYLRRLESV